MDYPGKVITKTQVTPTQTSASGNWTLDDQAAAIKNNNWPVALVPNPISKSLRFNSADSAYLNRTLTTPTDGKRWTWSGWVKRGILTNGTGTVQQLFSAGSATAFFRFSTTDTLLSGWTGAANLETTQVFRDASAWYHIMLVVDTTQATASNRVKYYVNGSQITAFSSTDYPTQNSTTTINSAVAHNIGAITSSQQYFNGYMTEINFIDGQALTPSSFGMTNPQTGQWIPLKYSGTYGTNGFYLNFKDATSTTTLGYDYSGNANNWTTNNFSVTAGVGNDSLTDVPTPWFAYNTTGDVGGVIRGNYATLNPLDKNSGITLSNGNLDASMPTQLQNVYGTVSVTSGKWYWETTINSMSGRLVIGVGNAVDQSWNLDPASSSSLWGYYSVNGNKLNAGSVAYGNSFTTNDVIGVAVDMDSGKIWFSKNGTFQASGDPAAGTNAAFTNLSGSVRPMYDQQLTNAVTFSCNFGQRPFAYTPPTGFRSLCTTNLPATAIGFGLTNQAGKYFNPVLYTGTGTSQSITGVGFQPDWTWIKHRNGGSSHILMDALRTNFSLSSNLTNAELNQTSNWDGFLSDGFGVKGTTGEYNVSAGSYVAWNWKAGGTGVTNTAGSITSTVSANTTAGFSVVTYTGTGSNATVGHGLGAALNMIILKRTNSTNSWQVYHSNANASPASGGLFLNTTDAFTTLSTTWNNTVPTSTVFSIGTAAGTNASGGTYVAYCFAAVPGYSAFGSYTGNGSADGPFVYTGFRPRFVMVKQATVSSRDWIILDTSRNTYNVADLQLLPNTSEAESTTFFSSTAYLDILSNGFKVRNTSVRNNENTATYIYACFAESPFQFANAR